MIGRGFSSFTLSSGVGEGPVHPNCCFQREGERKNVGQTPARSRGMVAKSGVYQGSPRYPENFLHRASTLDRNLASSVVFEAHIFGYLVLTKFDRNARLDSFRWWKYSYVDSSVGSAVFGCGGQQLFWGRILCPL